MINQYYSVPSFYPYLAIAHQKFLEFNPHFVIEFNFLVTGSEL